MEKRTDEDLMKLITDKNTLALNVLYRRYEIPIFNFILRYTGSREIARELIQETFTRIWFASHTFDLQKGNFKGWLYTIALNITRNEMSKKQYTYHFVEVDEARDPRDKGEWGESEGPETILQQQELQHAVVNALGHLPPFLREVIIMKNYQHLKFREIAGVTNVPEGTVKARYHRAIALLRKLLNVNVNPDPININENRKNGDRSHV